MLFAFLLSLFIAGAPASADSFWRTLSWTTVDGVKLVGVYHPASRSGANTWVLLHGLGSHRGEWDAFGRKLAARGNGVFTYDARGHNESNHTTAGETITYQAWQSAGPGSPWDAMPSDLASAIQLLNRKYGLSERKIAVGGASLGANVALIYASQHANVPALVLLSPGMEYAGIQSAPAYQTYRGRPVFIAASPGDFYAYSSVRQLANLAASPRQTVAEGKNGHGVNMLDEQFAGHLLTWMRKQESQ